MKHQFFLFENQLGETLVTIQNGLIKLPEACLDNFLSIELAAGEALSTIAPHAILCTESPTKVTSLATILEGQEQRIEIFHFPVEKNGMGEWIILSDVNKSHTSVVIDSLLKVFRSQTPS